MNATVRLSKPQRGILRNLLRYVEHAEALPGALRVYGKETVPVKWRRGGRPKGRADSAAFSRALRRLESRGLVVRTNVAGGMPSGPRKGSIRQRLDEPHGTRTDHVFLTDL